MEITETPITNGAYNAGLDDAILECHKVIGQMTLDVGMKTSAVPIEIIRQLIQLIQRIDSLRLGRKA